MKKFVAMLLVVLFALSMSTVAMAAVGSASVTPMVVKNAKAEVTEVSEKHVETAVQAAAKVVGEDLTVKAVAAAKVSFEKGAEGSKEVSVDVPASMNGSNVLVAVTQNGKTVYMKAFVKDGKAVVELDPAKGAATVVVMTVIDAQGQPASFKVD